MKPTLLIKEKDERTKYNYGIKPSFSAFNFGGQDKTPPAKTSRKKAPPAKKPLAAFWQYLT